MAPTLFHGMEDLSRAASSSVVASLWQGLVLALAVSLSLRLVPRTTAAIRFAIWTVVFTVLATLPLLHAYFLRAAGDTADQVSLINVDERWSFAIAALWLVVSLARAAKLVFSAVQLRRIWQRAEPVETNAECERLLAIGGVQRAKLCVSNDVDRPSVIGFFSPKILLPRHLFEQLSSVELEQIVLHEVGHLQRADDWMNLLQKIGLVLVPLNPALLWIERRLCFERELACDDAVLRRTNAPKAYATCLTNLAEHRLGRSTAALSLGAWERRSELAQRVHSILRRSEGMSKTQARLVLGMLVLGLVGGAAELSRCPQFVSFSNDASLHGEAQTIPSTAYQPVSFHPGARFSPPGAAHETLVKASMPINPTSTNSPISKRPTSAHRHAIHAPALVRSTQNRASIQPRQQVQQWLMLTTWDEPVRPRIVLTVSDERVFSSSFAAVSTETGWLLIQL